MGHRRRARALVALGVAAALLCGCAASAGSAGGTASPAPDADFATTLEIGDGREMYLECRGTGSPTVVIVAGQRAAADDWMIVADGVADPPVFSRLSQDTRVCAYDRPGTPVGGQDPSRSDPVPQPADAQRMVDDLAALLIAAEIREPVVLAAHSAGGLAARLFASTRPDAVAGLVLVDALSETMQDAMTAEEWLIQKPLLRGDIDASIAEYPALEWIDAELSFAQLRAAPPLRQMPVIVISSDQPIGPTIPGLKAAGAVGADVPDDFGYITDRAQAQSQAAQAALVPGSVFITETDSGHNVHLEQPALVADAVLQVVQRVRQGAATAAG